jgi:FkbM family methyltransferase
MLLLCRPLLPSPVSGVCNGAWMEFDVGEVIQRLMYFGDYEPVQSQWVREVLRPGGVFLDIGANVGHYTTLAASLVGSTGRVVAFEPSPYAYAKLKAVLEDNHLDQVSLFQSAAGDQSGQLDLYLPSEGYLHSPSLVQSDESYTPVKVEVCCLDSHPALANLPAIDMMKIDVEGFEPNALRGMCASLMSGKVKYLMCEFNSGWLEANGSSCSQLLELIKGMNFVAYKQTPLAKVVAPNGLAYQHQDILFKFSPRNDS